MHALFLSLGEGATFTLNKPLSASSASSPVVSATAMVYGNDGSGTLLFDGVGSSPEYSKNGGAWTSITDGLTLAMTNGDTIAVREFFAVSDFAIFNVKNNATGAIIESVTLERT